MTKTKRTILVGLALLWTLAAMMPCAIAEEGDHMTKANTLVAYFSCTGNTRRVAAQIADALDADLYEIQPETPYTAEDLNWNNSNSRSSREHADVHARPAIAEPVEDMARYDIVFIGYPSWWGEAPRIVSTFLQAYDFAGKTIVPFCTSASSGLGSSAELLHALCNGEASWLAGQRFASNAPQRDVLSWVEGLKPALAGQNP